MWKFILAVWIGILSVAAVIVTAVDKKRAGMHAWRISENTLILIAALGGSLAMLLTMLLIRHKTRHIKFMLGIPLILLMQAVLFWYLFLRF